MWELDHKKVWVSKNWYFWTGVLEKTLWILWTARRSKRKSTLNIHWKDWGWSWSSNILATWCKELIHWKRPWCWKRLRAGGEGDDRGWDGWMTSLTQWTRLWASSGSWWWAGKPTVLQSMGLQRVRHDLGTEEQLLILHRSVPVYLMTLLLRIIVLYILYVFIHVCLCV